MCVPWMPMPPFSDDAIVEARNKALSLLPGEIYYYDPSAPMTFTPPKYICRYCGTGRMDRNHNCRTCAGMETV